MTPTCPSSQTRARVSTGLLVFDERGDFSRRECQGIRLRLGRLIRPIRPLLCSPERENAES